MTPAIEALAGELAGRLTTGAGRRTEPPERRTGSPVRRNSWAPGRAGQRVALTWTRRARILWAFRKWERRQQRRPGAKIRACGYVAERVYELLLNEAVRRKGALEHLALERIAQIVGHSKSAVVAAIARLKAFGWLDWVRTFRDTGQRGLRGPQVEQGINAYWICVPPSQASAVDPPPPDDDADRRKRAATDRSSARDPDSPLGAALARYGSSLAERESADRSDSVGMKIKSASALRPTTSFEG